MLPVTRLVEAVNVGDKENRLRGRFSLGGRYSPCRFKPEAIQHQVHQYIGLTLSHSDVMAVTYLVHRSSPLIKMLTFVRNKLLHRTILPVRFAAIMRLELDEGYDPSTTGLQIRCSTS